MQLAKVGWKYVFYFSSRIKIAWNEIITNYVFFFQSHFIRYFNLSIDSWRSKCYQNFINCHAFENLWLKDEFIEINMSCHFRLQIYDRMLHNRMCHFNRHFRFLRFYSKNSVSSVIRAGYLSPMQSIALETIVGIILCEISICMGIE